MPNYANAARSLLITAVSATATSFTVNSGEGCKFPTDFSRLYIRLGTDATNEVAVCTARNGDTFTCLALSGSYAKGTPVVMTINAGLAGDVHQIDVPQVFVGPREVAVIHGNSGAAIEIDYDAGNVHTFTVDQATVVSFVNWPASGTHGELTLIITGGSVGITWPAGKTHPQNPAFILSASGRDTVVVMSEDGGVTLDITMAFLGVM